MKKISRILLAMVILFLGFAVISFSLPAQAEEVTLAWDANSESDLAGYKLYYKIGDLDSGPPFDGTTATQGDSPVTITLSDLSDSTSPEFTLDLKQDGYYDFALTAFDLSGMESDYSEEVGYEATLNPPGAPTSLTIK